LFQNGKHCDLAGLLRDPFLLVLPKAHRRYRGGSFVFGCKGEQVSSWITSVILLWWSYPNPMAGYCRPRGFSFVRLC